MNIEYHTIEDLKINDTWKRSAYRSACIMSYKYVIKNTENAFLSYNAPLGAIFFGFSRYPRLGEKLSEWSDLRTESQDRIIKKYFSDLTHYGSASHMFDMILPISKENIVKEYFEAQLDFLGDLPVVKFDLERISERQKELLSMFDRFNPNAEKIYEAVNDLENSKPSEFKDLLIKDENMWVRLFLNIQKCLEPPLPPLESLGSPESETDFFDRKLVKANAHAAALINLLNWPTFYSKVDFLLKNYNREVTAPKADGSLYSYREELTRYKKTMEEKYPFLLMEFD